MPTHAQRLIHAVRTRNYDRLRELIKLHGDVDARSKANRTALHAAAEEGDMEAARILIAAGADVNSRMKYGASPLHLAAGYGGGWDLADLDKDRVDLFRRGRDRHINPSVATAIIEILKEINPNLPSQLAPEEEIPSEFKGEVFMSLIQSMAKPAALYSKLTERGIDLERIDPDFADQLRGRPRFLRLVKFLLDHGADINALDDFRKTVLQSAVTLGTPEMVELLLRWGANPNPEPAGYEDSLIRFALERSEVDIADLLMRQGAKLDLTEARYLHEAAANGRVKVVQWLLDNQIDINLRDEEGNTALMSASGHHETFALLISRQAKVDGHNNLGRGVMHSAAIWPKCLDLLIPLGLSVSEPDAEGSTPLHLAAQSSDVAAIKALLGAGAAVNAQNHSGNTPLHSILSSAACRPDFVEFPVFHAMVAAGVDRSIRNQEDKTAFDLATQSDYPKEYLELLQPGLGGAEHARAFVWLRDEQYREFLPAAMVTVEVDGKTWPSCQHYFNAQMTDDGDVRERMRQAPTPEEAFRRLQDLGLKVSNTWSETCDIVTRAVLTAKFNQHAHLRKKLLETGKATLISDSNCDWYWIYEPGMAFNFIGQMLMSIRDELRTTKQ